MFIKNTCDVQYNKKLSPLIDFIFCIGPLYIGLDTTCRSKVAFFVKLRGLFVEYVGSLWGNFIINIQSTSQFRHAKE